MTNKFDAPQGPPPPAYGNERIASPAPVHSAPSSDYYGASPYPQHAQPYPNNGYPPQGHDPNYPPQQGGYYAPGPQMGYPQQGGYPQQSQYGPQGGHHGQPQGQFVGGRGSAGKGGIMGALVAALACCCCLDCLF